MKTTLKLVIIFTFMLLSNSLGAQDYYLKFAEPNKQRLNTTITQAVSIDKVDGDTIYAYASNQEFERFRQLGYTFDILPYPSSNTKGITMASSVDEMASWDKYPTYEVYREMMKRFEKQYPSLCKLDSIGTSVNGRKLYVLKISDNVQDDEPELEFFYTSTMHGDETTGFVLMLRLIDYLLSNYNSNAQVTNLVDSYAIYINPNANPDGTYYYGNNTVSGSRRYNANGYDVNRNFPDPRVGENPNGPYQPETIAMMDFAAEHSFVLSANFHGGIELANFPWDAWESSDNPHPDHNWFKTISRQYANLAQSNSPAGYFTGWDNGIAHGGDWYVVEGSRQDYMNYFHNCREITLEISDTKCPSSDELPNFWDYNKEAMLTYMELLNTGFQGTVTNSNGEPLEATITIANHDKDNSFVKTNPTHGLYYRPIEPGTWNITYQAEGYIEQTHTLTINSTQSKVIKNVTLDKLETFDITFEVTSSGSPIHDATISFNGQTQETNEYGTAIFTDIEVGSHALSVTCNGYADYSEQIQVDADKTIQINLTPLSVKNNSLAFNTKIWPNPFTETLRIELTFTQTDYVDIHILSILGKQIATIANQTVTPGTYQFSWTPNKTSPPGLYLVNFRVNGQSRTEKILFAPNCP